MDITFLFFMLAGVCCSAIIPMTSMEGGKWTVMGVMRFGVWLMSISPPPDRTNRGDRAFFMHTNPGLIVLRFFCHMCALLTNIWHDWWSVKNLDLRQSLSTLPTSCTVSLEGSDTRRWGRHPAWPKEGRAVWGPLDRPTQPRQAEGGRCGRGAYSPSVY